MRLRSTAACLLFTLLLSAITTIVCGVLPLLHVRRLEIARSLGDGSAGIGRRRPRPPGSVRALIVASQVAVTCVLVIGGVLLARSFGAQIDADRGYEPSNLLTAADPVSARATRSSGKSRRCTRILERLRAPPRHHPCGREHRVAAGVGRRLLGVQLSIAAARRRQRRCRNVSAAWSRRTISTRSASACAPAGPSTTATPRTRRAPWSSIARSSPSISTTFRSSVPIGLSLGTDAVRATDRQGRSVHRRRGRRHEAGPARRAAAGGDVRVVCAVARHQSRRRRHSSSRAPIDDPRDVCRGAAHRAPRGGSDASRSMP